MKHKKTGGTPNSRKKRDPDFVGLRVTIPVYTRNHIRKICEGTGQSMSDVTSELLLEATIHRIVWADRAHANGLLPTLRRFSSEANPGVRLIPPEN